MMEKTVASADAKKMRILGIGMFVLLAISMLAWTLGLHGQGIVSVVTLPAMMTAFGTNAELVAAGQPTVFAPIFTFMLATSAGGAGNMLSLAVCCLRSKSERLRAVGKAGLVPAIFNISEPMIFGTPVMYNPLIAIPMILNSLICMGFVFLGFSVGFFQNPYILMFTPLPVGLATFLASMAWQNVLIPVVCFVIAFVVYTPFVKMYDKQCLADEEAANEQAAA